MLNPFRIQQHKRGGAGAEHERATSPRIGNWKFQTFESHELAVGNPTQLGFIRNSPKGRKGGGSTPNTRWPGRRLKIAVNKYTIGYKYTQLRIDGKRLLQVLSSYAVMHYTTMSYTSQSCNIQHPPACGGWVSRFLISEMIHNSVPSGGRDHSDGRS